MEGKNLLIDGTNFTRRVWEARTLGGKVAVDPASVLDTVVRMIGWWCGAERTPPALTWVAFDGAGASDWRKAIDPAYKGGRKEKQDDLLVVLDGVSEHCRAMGLRVLTVPGHEADDTLATLAYEHHLDHRTSTILTSDKDLLQALTWYTEVKLLGQKSREATAWDATRFAETYGFGPIAWADYKALVGDTSDNIKGVRGIGPKTAERLLRAFGTLDGLYTVLHRNDPHPDVSGLEARRLLMLEHDARRCLKLTTLRRDVPLV